MKRFLLSTCVLVMFFFILSGCANISDNIPGEVNVSEVHLHSSTESNQNAMNDSNDTNVGEYQVFIYDYSDSIPSAKHEVEYEFADHEKYDQQMIETYVELSVNGKKHVGDFQSRQYSEYNYFPTNRYLDKEGYFFETDDCGVLTSFFWGETSSGKENMTQDACVQIAKDFLSGIVDISQYEINVDDNKARKFYTISFTKHLNGFKTADEATVVVQYDGEIYSYSSFMLGRVAAESFTDVIDTSRVLASIDKKINRIYEEAKYIYSRIDYGEPDMMLTVLKDGSIGVICTVEINCVKVIGEFEETVSERVNLVVVVV